MVGMRLAAVIGLLFVSPSLARAQLRFTQPRVDMGEVRGGQATQHRFDFVNDSDAPIEIADIRVGCGCLKPMIDKRLVLPREKGSIVMHLRTLGQADGVRTYQAFVQYRQAGIVREVPLARAARIVNEVTVEPSILALSVGTTLRQTVTFTDRRAKPARIVAAQASSRALKVTPLPAQGGVTTIVLEVSRADLIAEREEATLNLYTDDPAYRQLQVPITLTKAAQAAVTATPARVELVGNDARLVRLRGAGDRLVRIEKASADHPALSCSWAPGPGNEATLKIRLNATLLTTPDATATVRIQFAEPARASLSLPVQARKE